MTAQLIDANDGRHVWAQAYDRDIGDLFIVQEEIIRALAFRVGREIERPLPHSIPKAQAALATFQEGSPDSTLGEERRRWEKIWTAPGSLDRWIEDMRFAGMPE